MLPFLKSFFATAHRPVVEFVRGEVGTLGKTFWKEGRRTIDKGMFVRVQQFQTLYP